MLEAVDCLFVSQNDVYGGLLVEKRDEVYEWLSGKSSHSMFVQVPVWSQKLHVEFTNKCLGRVERIAEEAIRNDNHNAAIACYSAALKLNPESPEDILFKRSEAYAATGSWEDALADADEVHPKFILVKHRNTDGFIQVIKRNHLLPQAFKMKHLALRKLERHDEIIKTLSELPAGKLRLIPERCLLRFFAVLLDQNAHMRATIDETVKEILHNAPLRMIDTETGHLCEAARLKSVFEGNLVFGDLILSMTERVDTAHIKHVVKEFFRYVMFSHRWQGKEPLFGDVKAQSDQSVYSLPTDNLPTAIKLQTFCRTASKVGYRWAWSDTCCIDQTNQREFEKSINSMFRWYHHSALTLVYLWDVSPSALPGGLSGSAWITRGWTLQELLAPTVIRFFHADWTPYLFESHPNHKESDVITKEIANAVGVTGKDLLSFRPSSDDVRWKLHMASKRDTTAPEDAAYCLFGIFSVVMPVIPGETPHQAVARLLQMIIICSKSGDVGCLAWVGESSELNSCLPTQVKAYQESSHTPASVTEEEIQRSLSALESSFSMEEQVQALTLYDELARQPRAEFTGWILRLPCIVFRVTANRTFESNTNVYIAKAKTLEETRICTARKFSTKSLLLVCPWIHELLDLGSPHGHRDMEADFEFTSDAREESVLHENDDDSIRRPRPNNDHSQSDHLNVPYEISRPSTPSTLPPPSPATPFDERTRALRLVARVRRPMTALLLSHQRHGYKRVATDHEIVIQLRKQASLDSIIVKMVEII